VILESGDARTAGRAVHGHTRPCAAAHDGQPRIRTCTDLCRCGSAKVGHLVKAVAVLQNHRVAQATGG
jgi:hypothetical protein